MAVTNYYSVNGQIIAEKTTGGSRIDYLTDALGSVTATVDQSANIINTYRYKPYGGLLAKTGAGADPAFQWVGNQGYRQTGKSYSDVYVRARHYSSALGRWTTLDPLWHELQNSLERLIVGISELNRYGYGLGNPTKWIDSTGYYSAQWQPCDSKNAGSVRAFCYGPVPSDVSCDNIPSLGMTNCMPGQGVWGIACGTKKMPEFADIAKMIEDRNLKNFKECCDRIKACVKSGQDPRRATCAAMFDSWYRGVGPYSDLKAHEAASGAFENLWRKVCRKPTEEKCAEMAWLYSVYVTWMKRLRKFVHKLAWFKTLES